MHFILATSGQFAEMAKAQYQTLERWVSHTSATLRNSAVLSIRTRNFL